MDELNEKMLELRPTIKTIHFVALRIIIIIILFSLFLTDSKTFLIISFCIINLGGEGGKWKEEMEGGNGRGEMEGGKCEREEWLNRLRIHFRAPMLPIG